MKNIREYICFYLVCLIAVGCSPLVEDDYADEDLFTDSGMVRSIANLVDTSPLIVASTAEIIAHPREVMIKTKNVSAGSIVNFAQTLTGIPYKYASSDPKFGFDCSGFITHVFNHFDIEVPRSSKDFTNIGEKIPKENARPGDLILFTGTDHTERGVGHMGIVTFSTRDTLLFIHSTSGKANGVTTTPLNDYYKNRFVKVIRVLKDND